MSKKDEKSYLDNYLGWAIAATIEADIRRAQKVWDFPGQCLHDLTDGAIDIRLFTRDK